MRLAVKAPVETLVPLILLEKVVTPYLTTPLVLLPQLQVKPEAVPELIGLGEAEIVAVGAATTVTVFESVSVVPTELVHVKV